MISLFEKIKSREEAQKIIENWKKASQKVVLTNGCFDILHEGHVRYLAEAKNLGDKLIVCINADSSVKILKGENRPFNNENSRSIILAGLASVDLVVIFSEVTPLEIIKLLVPNLLVKGGDYKPEEIVGYDLVKSSGGEVKCLTFYPGHSTSLIADKILKS